MRSPAPGSVRSVGERVQGCARRESRYSIRAAPSVLDIIDVPLRKAHPEGHQQENWLIDPRRRWDKVDRLNSSILCGWTDAPDTLWVNGASTSSGQNDKIHIRSCATPITGSLYLISVNMRLRVFQHYGVRRVQGHFRYGDARYRMWVTDPSWENEYLRRPDGIYRLGTCLATISLGLTNDDGYAYTLTAAIIKP